MENQPAIPPTQFQTPASYQQPMAPVPQKPKRSLPIAWVVVFVLVLAVCAVYLWQNNKVKNLNDKINTLNGKVISSTRANVSTSKDYLYLYQYGVKIPLTSNIEGLYEVGILYSDNGLKYDVLSFSTQTLGQASPTCWATPTDQYYEYTSLGLNPGTPTEMGPSPFSDLIAVSKTPLNAQNVGATITSLGHINGYYFYTLAQNAESQCEGATGAVQTLTQQEESSYKSAIKNIQPID